MSMRESANSTHDSWWSYQYNESFIEYRIFDFCSNSIFFEKVCFICDVGHSFIGDFEWVLIPTGASNLVKDSRQQIPKEWKKNVSSLFDSTEFIFVWTQSTVHFIDAFPVNWKPNETFRIIPVQIRLLDIYLRAPDKQNAEKRSLTNRISFLTTKALNEQWIPGKSNF